MTDEEIADLRTELDSYKREVARLDDEVASAYRKLHAALSGGYERGLRLRTAWASARMGRAKARKESADLRDALTLVGQSLSLVGERAGQAETERDRLKATIERHEDLLASIVLYIRWLYVTRSLTTEQKDLFADALERAAIRAHGPGGDEPDPDMARLPSYAPRWWRSPEEDQPKESST